MNPTPMQIRVAQEVARIARDGGPFVALTVTCAYREPGNPDPTLIRFAHATGHSSRDDRAAAIGLLALPPALHRVAGELERKLRDEPVPSWPETPAQRDATILLERFSRTFPPWTSITVTGAWRGEGCADPDDVLVTHAAGVSDDARSVSLALGRMPKTLRQIADLLELQLRRMAGASAS